MKYKCSPIFKYIILLISIFMFIKHLSVLNDCQNFLISISILAMVITFDYILIENHPNPFVEEEEDNSDADADTDSEIEQFSDAASIKEYIKEVLDGDTNGEANEGDEMPKRKVVRKVPKPSYDLDNECSECTRE